MQLIHFLTSEPAPKTLKRHVMHSQVHRGISLIVLPLLSERVGERLLFPHSVLSNTTGNLANCSPSPFGEGWGEAAFYLPLPSERVGERLYRVCFGLSFPYNKKPLRACERLLGVVSLPERLSVPTEKRVCHSPEGRRDKVVICLSLF